MLRDILSQIDLSPLPNVRSTPATTQKIVIFIFGLIGSIFVIVLLLIAFQYIVSRGNPEATGRLRDGIIYAAIGVAITVLAGAIVSFIIGKV